MPDSPKDLRQKILGRKGEELTCKYLKKRGYRILERNYSTPFGEADIVAVKDEIYCFVEVKSRENTLHGLPAEAVDAKKRERYRKIARFFCTVRRTELTCRFDVASVLDGTLEYFEDAYI